MAGILLGPCTKMLLSWVFSQIVIQPKPSGWDVFLSKDWELWDEGRGEDCLPAVREKGSQQKGLSTPYHRGFVTLCTR